MSDEPGPVSTGGTGGTGVDAPPASNRSLDFTFSVVRLMPPLAWLALAALLFGRVLAPAMWSVGVGMGKEVYALTQVGAIASQAFAFAATLATIVVALTVSRSRLPGMLRFAALPLSSTAVVPMLWALHLPVNDGCAALVAASASILTLLAVPTLLSAPFVRAPGIVIGLVALAGIVRLGAVGIAFQAMEPHAGRLGSVAGAIATGAFLLDTAAVAVAFAWIASRGKRLTSPGTLVVMALALFCTRQALAGQGGEGHPLDLLIWRAASRLMGRPEPLLPLGFRVFVAFLAPLVAIMAMFARDVLAPLGAVVALALAAHGAIEMPPCALMLVVSALGAAIVARDGMWVALKGAKPGREAE